MTDRAVEHLAELTALIEALKLKGLIEALEVVSPDGIILVFAEGRPGRSPPRELLPKVVDQVRQ